MAWRRMAVLLAGAGLLWARTAGATEARAFLLGLPNLTPDEQADLAHNPAKVHAVDGARLFGNLDASYSRSSGRTEVIGFPASNSSFRSANLFPVLEWVNAPGKDRWAVRYEPRFTRSVSRNGVMRQDGWTQSPARGRVIYGRGDSALSFRLEDGTTHQDSAGVETTSGFHTYTLAAGVLRGAGTDRRLGLTLSARYGTATNNGSTAFENGSSKTWGMTLRATPERTVSEKTSFRGQLLLGQQITDYSLNLPGHGHDAHTTEYELGAGWAYQAGEDTAWHMTAQGVGSVGLHTYDSPLQDTNGQKSSHAGFLRVAVEQRIMGGRLTLRAAAEPLFISYSREKTPTSNARALVMDGLSNYFLGGVGFQATERLAVDIQLGRQNFIVSNTDSNTGTLTSSSNSAAISVSVAAAYRL